MVGQLTANDLKTRGISAIDEMVSNNDGVVITVRGIEKYVILPIGEYNQLREFELDAAIQESMQDITSGRSYSGTVEDHLKRMRNV